MMDGKIDDTLSVRASPDAVVIETNAACTEEGETLPGTVYLVLPPAEAIAFANAILHASANLPDEDLSDLTDDHFATDGTIKAKYAS